MDAPLKEEEEGCLIDVIIDENEETPDAGLLEDSLKKEVARVMAMLTLRESQIISFYFGLNGNNSMTLEEIGAKFNLTQERVRQIKEKATRRLRNNSRSKLLKSYLG
jgi:RNA polymerase primary sigma factor